MRVHLAFMAERRLMGSGRTDNRQRLTAASLSSDQIISTRCGRQEGKKGRKSEQSRSHAATRGASQPPLVLDPATLTIHTLDAWPHLLVPLPYPITPVSSVIFNKAKIGLFTEVFNLTLYVFYIMGNILNGLALCEDSLKPTQLQEVKVSELSGQKCLLCIWQYNFCFLFQKNSKLGISLTKLEYLKIYKVNWIQGFVLTKP